MRRTAIVGIVALGALSLASMPATAAARAPSPVQTANAFIAQHPARVDYADPAELVRTGQAHGLGGVTVVRYDQLIHGVPVLGAAVVVVVNAAHQVVSASGETLNAPLPAIGPSVSSADAQQRALRAVSKGGGDGVQTGTPSLVTYDPTILGAVGGGPAVLAWRVAVGDGHGMAADVLLDATTGALIRTISTIQTAKNRAVCDAEDGSGKIPCTSVDYVATENQNPPPAPFVYPPPSLPSLPESDAIAAFSYTGLTYDFYDALGRDSIDGNGLPLISTVRSSTAIENAYWDGSQMVFGTGYASALDVVAHELTHGVTQYTSQLIYADQPGALNEALSDIMGELVEQSQPNHPVAWELGEDLPIGAIRSMSNPPDYGQPDSMKSPNYYVGTEDNGGVHTNSGVANKTAYLIAMGGTFGGQTVTGIGVAKSSYLWYQTEFILRPASSFADLADALDLACSTLVGTAGITANDCAQVSAAEAATALRTRAPNALTTPPMCVSGPPADAFSDDFASGLANWTAGHTVGTMDVWYPSTLPDYPDGVSSHWPLQTSTSVRGVEPTDRTDSTLTMAAGVVVPANARFRFVHHHAFESSSGFNYDGGVVEYSVDGGAWTDANGLHPINGYNGVLDATFDSPAQQPTLVNRRAFVATSVGAVTTQYNLSLLAGHSVRFRFRISTDADNGNIPEYGWFIGSVSMFGCEGVAPTTEPAPTATTTTNPLEPAVTPTRTSAAVPPKGGIWVADTVRGKATVSLPLRANRTYRIVASNGGQVRRGTCSRNAVSVTCVVKRLTQGRWRVAVTSYHHGVRGAAWTRTLRFTR